MPLHLKQKLRKALHPNGSSNSNSNEGQFVQAGSLREPKALNNDEKIARTASGSDGRNSEAAESLSAGLGRLSLNGRRSEQQNGELDAATAAEYGVNAPYGEDRVVANGAHGRKGYPRSIAVSEDESDPYSEHVADRNLSPSGNWTYSEDVDVEQTQLPAVTHETRIVNTHEIVRQEVTRDIHNYDVYHRVLPVIDVEVLPPRHFVPSKSGESLVEISASQVPFGGSDDAAIQRSIKQAYLKERLEPRSAGAS